MIIETWIAIMFFLVICTICAVALIGWIYEGEKLQKQIKENKALRNENKMLATRLAHRNALDNIKVANEYYEESLKNE